MSGTAPPAHNACRLLVSEIVAVRYAHVLRVFCGTSLRQCALSTEVFTIPKVGTQLYIGGNKQNASRANTHDADT